MEKQYITLIKEYGGNLYNVTEGGDGSLGLKHTMKAKLKQSKNALNRKLKGTLWYRCRPCIINGIEYPSQTEAARQLNTGRNVVHRWVKEGRNGSTRARRSDCTGFKEGYTILQDGLIAT